MPILKWLRLNASRDVPGEDADAVHRIAAALDRLDPGRARYIAAFAYLLGRVACADREVSADETRVMERIVRERGDLPEEQAALVVQIARSQNLLFGGTEDFLVAREFEQMSTREQRLGLLDCLFAVSAADQSITVIEDNEISRIAQSLKLEHSDLVRARLAYKKYLRVLQRPDDARYKPTH
jgi:uncharacterized tellurite resistance protein B-like protein